MIVQVAAVVHSLRLIVIDNPIMLIDDVLEEVLVTWPHVHHEEPLVRERIKVHLVSHSPVIHRAAELHAVVSWSSVRQGEGVADLV